METPKNYIIKCIDKLKAIFPEVKIRYAYDEKTYYHILEISPEDTFNSTDFTGNLLIFWEDFKEKYPKEDIVTCQPSICNNMSNLIYEVV